MLQQSGEKMTSQPKKTILIAKLSALNRAIASFKHKCRTAWSIAKQVWYIPFLWSLAWYSYWIFHGAIVLKTPLLQGNVLNYSGAAISIVALLIAGYRARAPIRRSVETASAHLTFHKNQSRLGQNSQNQSLPLKPMQGAQAEHPKQTSMPQAKRQLLIETSQLQKETKLPQKPAHPPSSVSALPQSPSQSSQSYTSKNQGTENECLTCANLINCAYRQKRIVELKSQGARPTPCRYAAELARKNA